MKIIVSSRNPVKINATLEGFKQVFSNEKFEVEGVLAQSSVSAQPMDSKRLIKEL